jgi:tetratricopeptide (TPR) repeat protein
LEGRVRHRTFALLVIVLAWPHGAGGQPFKPCIPGYKPYGTWCVLGEPPDHLKCQWEFAADLQVRLQYCTSAIESKQHAGAELANVLSARAGIHEARREIALAIADYSEAAHALRSAGQSVGTSIDLYGVLRSRAAVYEEAGDDQLALADYGEMIRQSPGYSQGW